MSCLCLHKVRLNALFYLYNKIPLGHNPRGFYCINIERLTLSVAKVAYAIKRDISIV